MKNPEDFCLKHSAMTIWILRCAQDESYIINNYK